jgi:branched-chain amino acid transport system ATP-binding protein
MNTLKVDSISAAYGNAAVLADVSLTARQGAITCILGANGAGKSTLVRCVLGLMPLKSGRISFGDMDLAAWPVHSRASLGIGCVPEGRRIFPQMTVEENLRVGAYLVRDEGLIAHRLASVYEKFPRLRERRTQLAGTMSGGEQAMVSIGRALMSEPKLLIVDEPSLGLSPALVQESFSVVEEINRAGVTILLIEQNVHQTLAISHYGYVLAQGRVVAEGAPADLSIDDEVQRAYFGKA